MAGAGSQLPAGFDEFVRSLTTGEQQAYAQQIREELQRAGEESAVLRRVVQLAGAAPPAVGGAAHPPQPAGQEPQPEPLEGVPVIRSTNDIKYDAMTNPVKVLPWAWPAQCAKLDLSADPIFRRLAGNAALRFEYEHWAPVVANLHVGLEALSVQVRAGDIPPERRLSLENACRHFRSTYAYALRVLDGLQFRALHGSSSPGVAALTDQAIMGPADHGMVSSAGRSVADQLEMAQLAALVKVVAKDVATSGAKGSSRGPEVSK